MILRSEHFKVFGAISEEEKKALLWSIEDCFNTTPLFEPGSGIFVEIGTLSAKTTRMIIEALVCLYWSAKVVTIDKDPSCLKKWEKNCASFGAKRSEFLCGRLRDVSLPSKNVFWAFIDGCHCMECVLLDIAILRDLIPVGGYLCFHDAGYQRALGMLVHERYHDRDGVERLYGVTEAIAESRLAEEFSMECSVRPTDRPAGASTPIRGGLMCYKRIIPRLDDDE